MGYEELLARFEANPEMKVTISVADLMRFNRDMFEICRREMMSAFRALRQDELLDRATVAKLLKVDLSTLNRWHKANILSAVRIGGKVYYRNEEVQAIVKTRNHQ